MARLRRAKGRSKHLHQESQYGPILKAKRVAKEKPVDWEEDQDGELQPIFAPQPLFTLEELEPYRSTPALFYYKKSLRKLVGSPFLFLKLPTELRVEIYRYCLVANYQVYPYLDTDEKWPTRLALSLLRTCSAMHDECAQILYGENEFRFTDAYDHLKLLRFLDRIGPVNSRWIRNLTMLPPFIDDWNLVYRENSRVDGVENFYAGYANHDGYPCPYLVRTPTGYQVDKTTWGDLCRSLVTILINLPRLRQLTILLPGEWVYHKEFLKIWHESRQLSPDTKEVWWCLSELLRVKPFLDVPIVHLANKDQCICPSLSTLARHHKRFLASLKRRLGIWDVRLVLHEQDSEWEMPDQMKQDPDEYLCDLRGLFAL